MQWRSFLLKFDFDDLLGIVPGCAGVGHEDGLIEAEDGDGDEIADEEERFDEREGQSAEEDGDEDVQHAFLRVFGADFDYFLTVSDRRFGYAFRTPYSAAKWGVIGLTQSLAKELGPDNIRVNAILPGIVEGPRMTGVIAARAKQTSVSFEAMEKAYLDRVSLRRMVTAGDVAATVAYLLSPAGRNISGQSLGVDGNVEAL